MFGKNEKEITDPIMRKKKRFFSKSKENRVKDNVNPNSLDRTKYHSSGKFTTTENKVETIQKKDETIQKKDETIQKKVDNTDDSGFAKKVVTVVNVMWLIFIIFIGSMVINDVTVDFPDDVETTFSETLLEETILEEIPLEETIIEENITIENYDAEAGVYLIGGNYSEMLEVNEWSLPPGDYKVRSLSNNVIKVAKSNTRYGNGYNTSLEQKDEEIYMRLHEGSNINVTTKGDIAGQTEALIELLPVDSLPEITEVTDKMKGDYVLSGNKFAFSSDSSLKMNILTVDDDMHYFYNYGGRTLVKKIFKPG